MYVLENKDIQNRLLEQFRGFFVGVKGLKESFYLYNLILDYELCFTS